MTYIAIWAGHDASAAPTDTTDIVVAEITWASSDAALPDFALMTSAISRADLFTAIQFRTLHKPYHDLACRIEDTISAMLRDTHGEAPLSFKLAMSKRDVSALPNDNVMVPACVVKDYSAG